MAQCDGCRDFRMSSSTFTNPNNADSDGDTLSDGDEVNTHGTDPKDSDSDNDHYAYFGNDCGNDHGNNDKHTHDRHQY